MSNLINRLTNGCAQEYWSLPHAIAVDTKNEVEVLALLKPTKRQHTYIIRSIGHDLPESNGYYTNQSACRCSSLPKILPFKPEAAKLIDSGKCSVRTGPATDRSLFRIVHGAAMLLALRRKKIPHMNLIFLKYVFHEKKILGFPKTVIRIITNDESSTYTWICCGVTCHASFRYKVDHETISIL